MTDILDKLADLLKQAETERSHFYVASCCREAIAEIIRLRSELIIETGGHRAVPVNDQAA